MEELLKLLVSNIYVVIIVVGFLLTLLNKARSKQKPGGNRMPPFGGGPDGRSQARPIAERPPHQPERQQSRTREAEPRPAAQRRQTAAPEASSTLGGSLYKSQEKPSGEGDSMELIGSGLLLRSMETGKLAGVQPKSTGSTPAGSRAKGDSFRMPQGNELRQAFIMAEVLGPPRSKRPLKQK